LQSSFVGFGFLNLLLPTSSPPISPSSTLIELRALKPSSIERQQYYQLSLCDFGASFLCIQQTHAVQPSLYNIDWREQEQEQAIGFLSLSEFFRPQISCRQSLISLLPKG
jgi:hypothetical protein